jgi:cation transporter-like permease
MGARIRLSPDRYASPLFSSLPPVLGLTFLSAAYQYGSPGGGTDETD